MVKLPAVCAFLLSVASLCPLWAAEQAHGEAKGPHGGAVLEVGEEVAHVEVVHDDKAGKMTLYILGKDQKTPVTLQEPPKLNLKTEKGNVQLAAKAVEPKDGAASQYEIADDALKADPLNGRIALTIDGKKYNVKLEDDHGHAK